MPPGPSADQPRLSRCPVCTCDTLVYQFTHASTPVVRCESCGLLLRNPQPSDAELAAIYTDTSFLGSGAEEDDDGFAREVHALKRATAAGYLNRIEAYRGWTPESRRGRTLLEVGSGLGNLLLEARDRGYAVTGIEYAPASVATANARLGASVVLQGTLESADLAPGSFDVCVLADVIEHVRDPLASVARAWELLRPGGTLFVATPSLDSWSARLMRQRWVEFKTEHLFYFDSRTLQTLLLRAGFAGVRIEGGRKTLSPEYVFAHFDRFPVPVLSPMGRLGRHVMPGPLRRWRLGVVASGIDVLATRTDAAPLTRRRAVLSVIMPVYNERQTFAEVMAQLLQKAIPDVEIESDRGQSHSTDGTRDEVRALRGPSPRARDLRGSPTRARDTPCAPGSRRRRAITS